MAQVVVITGASAGVGRATAKAFARQGACVALLARGRDGLAGAYEDVIRAGGEALVIPTDVADPVQVLTAAARVVEAWGRIDVWVNNATVTVFAPFMQVTPEEYQRVTDVTYLGTVYGTMAALRHMSARNQGTVVQVGSALAYRGIPLQSAYCGAKHAIQGFTESVRAELIHDHSDVRITMVQLPALNTPQFEWNRAKLPRAPQPVPPIYQPEVAARAIVWAARHAPREVNVGAMTSVVINGNKLLPGVGDWYLGRTGYDSQQTDTPLPPGRPDNLFRPVPGDHGAHGPFDDRAGSHSPQLFARMHRPTMMLAILGLALGARVVGRMARP
ncbi:MAG: SDR family oxidoreductase [Myxococcota bacterium]